MLVSCGIAVSSVVKGLSSYQFMWKKRKKLHYGTSPKCSATKGGARPGWILVQLLLIGVGWKATPAWPLFFLTSKLKLRFARHLTLTLANWELATTVPRATAVMWMQWNGGSGLNVINITFVILAASMAISSNCRCVFGTHGMKLSRFSSLLVALLFWLFAFIWMLNLFLFQRFTHRWVLWASLLH